MDGNPRTPSEISLNTPPEDEVASAEPDTVSAVLPPQRRRRLLKAISSKFSGVRRLRISGRATGLDSSWLGRCRWSSVYSHAGF